MTKAELKQKLEAVRSKLCAHHGNTFLVGAGYDQILPLFLDAYEALEFYGDRCESIDIFDQLDWSLVNNPAAIQDKGKRSRETLARIEAFATQGAHEQSEFENGEK